jgi:hypothetical protein
MERDRRPAPFYILPLPSLPRVRIRQEWRGHRLRLERFQLSILHRFSGPLESFLSIFERFNQVVE